MINVAEYIAMSTVQFFIKVPGVRKVELPPPLLKANFICVALIWLELD